LTGNAALLSKDLASIGRGLSKLAEFMIERKNAMWHLRQCWSKSCLVVLFLLSAVSFSRAQTDDLVPQPFSNQFGALIGGAVDIYPGNTACSPVIGVSQSITFLADVIPNKGTPRPKIHIFYSPNDPTLGNATVIFASRSTGPSVLTPPTNQYSSAGFYQVCFKYPAGQAQGPPGDAFDFIFVNLQIQFN
jgi:hypothetical protein